MLAFTLTYFKIIHFYCRGYVLTALFSVIKALWIVSKELQSSVPINSSNAATLCSSYYIICD